MPAERLLGGRQSFALPAFGLEFVYLNEESFYCGPVRQDGGERLPAPEATRGVCVASLPPMSGLAANKTRLDPRDDASDQSGDGAVQ